MAILGVSSDTFMKGMKGKKVLVAQSCPTHFNPLDGSLSVSSVCGIFQVRILETVAISFSRKSSQPWDQTGVSYIAGRFFII